MARKVQKAKQGEVTDYLELRRKWAVGEIDEPPFQYHFRIDNGYDSIAERKQGAEYLRGFYQELKEKGWDKDLLSDGE